MSEKSYIDEVMSIDPSEVVTAFQNTQSSERSGNTNIYKTNPANTVSEDGNYHSRIRVLLNPYDIKHSIVHSARYSMRDAQGFFQVVSSLSVGDKNCPIFKGWKSLWFARTQDPSNPSETIEDATKKAWARKMFQKNEADWVLVQIIEDENQPELTGQFKLMKLPKSIMNRLQAKINPTDPKKMKQPLMDYLFGSVLDMNVQPGPDDPKAPERKQREISYDLCDFDTDIQPIICTDGTPLFTDEEIEIIEEYNNANIEMVKAKTQAKRDEAAKKKADLVNDIRPLYAKAIDYVKTYALNPVVECGYNPWTPDVAERVNRWLEKVLNMEDPENGGSAPAASVSEPAKKESAATANTDAFDSASADDDTDLPF